MARGMFTLQCIFHMFIVFASLNRALLSKELNPPQGRIFRWVTIRSRVRSNVMAYFRSDFTFICCCPWILRSTFCCGRIKTPLCSLRKGICRSTDVYINQMKIFSILIISHNRENVCTNRENTIPLLQIVNTQEY